MELPAYEAGPTGYGLARACRAAGIACLVAATSKIARAPGDRVKTDRRDGERLARLLRLGELVAVRVPEPHEEAARDLVRAREDCRGDLMRARHRLSKLLLRHGIVYQGSAVLEWVAQRLGLISPAPPVREPPLEVGPLSKLDLIDFAVADDHAVNGSAVRELGLPRDALIAVVDRDGGVIPSRGSTVVQPGDRLFVLVPRKRRADLEDVFSRWRRGI
jgi:hypothetical protein